MTDDGELDRIAARIRQLQEMTPERGCSEAEARLALERAAALMKKNNLSDLDLVMTHADGTRPVAVKATVRDPLWAAVAHFTNTAAITMRDMRTGRRVIRFYGRAPAPEIAAYVRDLLDASVDYEIRQFHRTPGYRRLRKKKTRTRAGRAFVAGMVERLTIALRERFHQTHDPATYEEARRHCDERNPDAVTRKAPRSKGHDGAREAGWRAGGRVEINKGVGARGPAGYLEGPG